MDASKKLKSRIGRAEIDAQVRSMLVDLIEPKLIAFSLGVSLGFVYKRLKANGYHRAFITKEEELALRKMRAEKGTT